MSTITLSVTQTIGMGSVPARVRSPSFTPVGIGVTQSKSIVNKGQMINQSFSIEQDVILGMTLTRPLSHGVGLTQYCSMYKLPYIVVGDLEPTSTPTIGS